MGEVFEKWLVEALLTVVFAWMVYHLFKIILAFRDENLRIERSRKLDRTEPSVFADDTPDNKELMGQGQHPSIPEEISEIVTGLESSTRKASIDRVPSATITDNTKKAAGNVSPKVTSVAEASDDEDWEGVETTELEDTFNSAATLVASSIVGHGNQLSQDLQLHLYGLYKQATEGPCTTPAPSFFNIRPRAKWEAWNKIGEMKQEDAMENYIALTQASFGIIAASGDSPKREGGSGMGPVFSSFAIENETEGESPTGIHAIARDGELERAKLWIKEGGNVNGADDEGRTAVHWAVDRGHLELVKFLAENGADLNAADSGGLTPLHYAVVCEYKEVAEELMAHGADADVADKDGVTARSLLPQGWKWSE